jgi:hypothetical protein
LKLWEGVLTSYDYDTKLWVFHFVDYDHDEWFVELELSVELYDPYYDPMSELPPCSWYLLVA